MAALRLNTTTVGLLGVVTIAPDLRGPERPSGQDGLANAVGLAGAGDQTAFARIVAAHHDDMVRVCYVICRDAEMAHDAVQDAWSIAWRQIARLREPDRLRPWLVAIAANEARQVLRRQRRRTVVELKVPRSDDDEGTSEWSRNVDLRNALGRLSADDRQLLAMRYVAGFDSSELSGVTGLSASGTRARIQRLLAVLRAELGPRDA
jgi:RNA polymerase sigma factor (sigma-70 family)